MSLGERHARALALARGAGAEVLVCADPGTVQWLTGVSADVETGPSPFNPPPVVVLAPQDPALLVVSADDEPRPVPAGVQAVVYEGFTIGPLRGPTLARGHVIQAIAGRPAAGDSLLARAFTDPAVPFTDLTDALREARAVKDADGLAAIRRALAVADAGQARLREALASGATEIEVLAEVRAAMDVAAGQRVPLLADLVSGPRSARMGGPPGRRTLRAGDLVLCDLAPRVDGTWGDSCSTVAVEEPSARQRAAHAEVARALARAIDAVRPGARAMDVDAVARDGLRYPHHAGHGIGSSYHEAPRLVPGDRTVLREDMVIALEPAFYAEDFGIRLEHVVRVTADGCEVLSTHRLDL